MREVRCKDCLREVEAGKRTLEEVSFTYNEAWARGIIERGGSRSDRCQAHREKHGINTQGLAVAYIDLETVGEVTDRENPTGPLGGLGPLPDAHEPRPGSTDLERFGFGMDDDHIREMLEKLSDPQRRVLILKAGTGTGKSTFGPYRLMDPPPDVSFRLTDLGPIVVTEPRVQATTGVANFVGGLSGAGGVGPGYPVGYQVSGDRNHDDACQLVYVTDGTMINWLREGRLSKIGTVIVDEAHERSTNIDFILGYLRRELHRYPHLRVIVTSATFSIPFYEEYFGGPDLVHTMEVPAVKTVGYGMPLFGALDTLASGEGHLLEEGSGWNEPGLPLVAGDSGDEDRFIRAHWPERFAPALGKDDVTDSDEVGWEEDLWETTRKLIPLRFTGEVPAEEWTNRMPEVLAGFVVDLVRGLEEADVFGDVLAFLPTSRTIEAACETIAAELGDRADVFPLISTLEKRLKEEALAARRKGDRRKVVVSTNLAETSLTVEGVRFVVDSGIIAQSEWDPELVEGGIPTKQHSQAGIKQRWGRVGRKAPGWVFPLYTKAQYAALAEDTPPGSTRDNLEQLVMTAKMGGIDDVVDFPWPAAFEPTRSELDESARKARGTFLCELERADGALRQGGAVDGDGHPTAFGRELVRFQGLGSTGGALAIMYADRLACVPEVVTILALLEDARLVGRDSLLLSDFDWPDEWRVEAAERHRGLASLCEDEADLVLQICASWERADPETPPWEPSRLRRDWARRWWVSNEVLIGAAEARRDVLQSLSPAMKEEVKRFVEPALLKRSRGVLTRALHGLRYERLDEGFRPWAESEGVESAEEEPALPEPDSLFKQTADSVIGLQRRRGRDDERYVSSLVSLEPWALPEDGGDPATDALRLLVAAAEHARPELAHSTRTALIESWPVGQRMLMDLGGSGERSEAPEPDKVLAPFALPLTREEAEAERAETRRAKKAARRKPRHARRGPAAEDQAGVEGATEADQSGEIDSRRPVEERIKDEEELERQAFEAAEAEEAGDPPCGRCPQCLSGHDDLCENQGEVAEVGGKIEDALHSWTARAAAGGAMQPRIAVEEPGGDPGKAWWEVVGYRPGTDGDPEVLLRQDWRPPGFVGDPTRHQNVDAGMPIEVEVGPPVRDHRDELRVFVRADAAGRFVLREATPGAKAQERRGEIAVSLDRSAQGLLGGLVRGELLTATVVPARGANCFSITLLELLQQHLGKASGGPAAPRLSPDPDKEKGERVEWHAGTVATALDAWGNLGVKLAHRDSERGIEHRVNVRLGSPPDSSDVEGEDDGEGPADSSGGAFAEGDAVAVRLERERPKLSLADKDLDSVKEICDEIDRRLTVKAAPDRDEESSGEGERWLGGPGTHLLSTRDAPVPRATASALAELDPSPGWQNQVWAFWARSHHLKPAGKKAIRSIDPVDPVEVRAEVKVEDRTPLAARQAAIAELGEKLAPGAQLEGIVTSVRNFGAFVELAPQVDGLVATKELRWERVQDPTEVVKRGDQVQVQVLNLDPETAELSLSIRSLLPHPTEAYADEHPPGSAVKGTVATVVRAGVFVDLADGVRGFVPRNELGWGGAEEGGLVAEGDEIEAAVVGLDIERRRLKLSIKKLQPHPFDAFRQANAVGDEVIGRVGKVTDIGAYVSLGGGLDGLVHVSEIAWRRLEHPGDVLSEGEEVKVRVLVIDEKRRRVSLSIKATQPDPFETFTSSNQPGSRVKGKVLRLSDKSAFVELEDGIEGFIPVSELSWKRVGVPADVLRVEETVEAKVLSSDSKRRQVKLSVKHLQPNPFDSVVKRAGAGETMTGTVVSLVDFGAFVELDEGAQGLIHISRLSTAFVSHPSQVVTPGQRVLVRVLSIDHSKRKISLVYAGPAT